MIKKLACRVLGHDWRLNWLDWWTAKAIREQCQRCGQHRSRPLKLDPSDSLWVRITTNR